MLLKHNHEKSMFGWHDINNILKWIKIYLLKHENISYKNKGGFGYGRKQQVYLELSSYTA